MHEAKGKSTLSPHIYERSILSFLKAQAIFLRVPFHETHKTVPFVLRIQG